MTYKAGCSTLRLAGLVIAMISLTGCATADSDSRAVVCPPVVEYSREFQARAAEELELLPNGLAITEMLSDYAVMREQANACAATRRLSSRSQV